MVAEFKTALADQVLNRQTEVALQWLKEGIFEVVIPIQYSFSQTVAKFCFKTDPNRKGQDRRGNPYTVDIRLDLPQTGKIEAWAQWVEGNLEGKIYVENIPAVTLFDSTLPALSASLRAAGFKQVNLEVRLDPVRLYKTEVKSTEAPLPGGSLLSVRI
jgi:hypothetical protein